MPLSRTLYLGATESSNPPWMIGGRKWPSTFTFTWVQSPFRSLTWFHWIKEKTENFSDSLWNYYWCSCCKTSLVTVPKSTWFWTLQGPGDKWKHIQYLHVQQTQNRSELKLVLLKLLFFTRHDSSFFSFSQSRISTVIIVVSLSFVDNDRGKQCPFLFRLHNDFCVSFCAVICDSHRKKQDL